MRFPTWLPVYGDKKYRGKCLKEETEQINFFSWLHLNHPDLHRLAIHPKVESKRGWVMAEIDKKTGAMNKGASDVVIPGCPSFVCEIKRRDHTQSQWQKGQRDYLFSAHCAGSFVCVALGAEGAKLAINDYLTLRK